MTPDPRLPGLLADLLAVAEYLGDLGLGDLVPPLPPRPEAGAAAGPGGGRADQPGPPPPSWAPSSGGASRRPSPSEIWDQARLAPAWAQPPPKDEFPQYEDARSGPAGRHAPPRARPPEAAPWIAGASSLGELMAGLRSCRGCRLSQDRPRVIPGRGPVGAPILFVIDQPPPEAARTGQYPSGPELALLDDIVSKGLRMDPGDVYVTPLAKCPRPDPDYQDTYPLKACAHVAHREIELVRPKAVVAMGRLVPGFLGGLESLSFDSLRSKKLTIGPRRIPLKATYDLATILESLDCKRLFWEDLKAVMRLL